MQALMCLSAFLYQYTELVSSILSLLYYPTRDLQGRPRPVEQEVTIFTIFTIFSVN